jgi:hypothetical protein
MGTDMNDDLVKRLREYGSWETDPRHRSADELAMLEAADALERLSQQAEPVAWPDLVEDRLWSWRQSFVNKSGDQLMLEDFMDKRSIDDLIDFVCAAPPAVQQAEPLAVYESLTEHQKMRTSLENVMDTMAALRAAPPANDEAARLLREALRQLDEYWSPELRVAIDAYLAKANK